MVKKTDEGTEMEYHYNDEYKRAESRLEYKTNQLYAIRIQSIITEWLMARIAAGCTK